MKIIKTFCLPILCICAANLVHAQEPKVEIAKPKEVKLPPASNISSPLSELKTQSGNMPTALTAAPTPSPFTKEQNMKTAETAKPVLTNGQANILAGNSERPKQPALVPIINEENKPQIIPVPVVLKEQ